MLGEVLDERTNIASMLCSFDIPPNPLDFDLRGVQMFVVFLRWLRHFLDRYGIMRCSATHNPTASVIESKKSGFDFGLEASPDLGTVNLAENLKNELDTAGR